MRRKTVGLAMLLAAVIMFCVGCPDDDSNRALPAGGDVVAQQQGTSCCIMVRKYEDLNANGLLDLDEPEMVEPEIQWPVAWEDPSGVIHQGTAPQWCINDGVPGLWSIWENSVDGWYITGAMVNWEPVQNYMGTIDILVPEVCEVEYYEVIFLNARTGGQPPQECNLVVRKINDLNLNGLVDPGEPELDDWPVTITNPGGVDTQYETPICIEADVTGMWTVTEGWREGWWTTGVILNGVPLGPGNGIQLLYEDLCVDQNEVIFLNATCGGVQPGSICAFKGYDPQGDGPDGDAPLAGIQLCLTGMTDSGSIVGPLCAFTGEDGTVCWSPLDPGTYVVYEVLPYCQWVASSPTEVYVELDQGENAQVVFSNYCYTTLDMHTKGWWQNKHGCAAISANPELLDALNALTPFMSGTIYTLGRDNCTGARCGTVTLPFDSASELGCYIVAPNNQNGNLGLAQQLAAFVLNVVYATGGLDLYFADLDLTAQEIVDAAVAAWETGMDVRDWQCLLDMLNNMDEVRSISPEPCDIIYNGIG